MTTAVDAVAAARAWIGTPYHHQASVRGVGCDCLGLVRGVWRDIYGADAEIPPAYTSDWAEALRQETLIDGARRHMAEIPVAEARAGDVLVFRIRPHASAKHCGVLSGADTMVHAQEGVPVTEVSLGTWWRRRIVAAFRFPEKEPA